MADMSAILAAAKLIQREVEQAGLARPRLPTKFRATHGDYLDIYDAMVTDDGLRGISRRLYKDRYYVRAVEEAYKFLNNQVKEKSGLTSDGQALMLQAYSEKEPILKLSDLKSDSKRNEQAGYGMILAGCMRGIRNPRAHDHEYSDGPAAALELLILCNHLLKIVESSSRARRKRKK